MRRARVAASASTRLGLQARARRVDEREVDAAEPGSSRAASPPIDVGPQLARPRGCVAGRARRCRRTRRRRPRRPSRRAGSVNVPGARVEVEHAVGAVGAERFERERDERLGGARVDLEEARRRDGHRRAEETLAPGALAGQDLDAGDLALLGWALDQHAHEARRLERLAERRGDGPCAGTGPARPTARPRRRACSRRPAARPASARGPARRRCSEARRRAPSGPAVLLGEQQALLDRHELVGAGPVEAEARPAGRCVDDELDLVAVAVLARVRGPSAATRSSASATCPIRVERVDDRCAAWPRAARA